MLVLWTYLAVTLGSPTVGPQTECEFRKLTYEYSLKIMPSRAPLLEVFDGLELKTRCGVPRPKDPKDRKWPKYPLPTKTFALFVDPEKGSNTNIGSIRHPFLTIERALRARRASSSHASIVLRGGLHFLKDPISLTEADSHMTIQNYDGEEVWLSGGIPLTTNWKPYNISKGANIWMTDLPNITNVPGLMSVSPHQRFTRARWPNPRHGTEELRPAQTVHPLNFLAPKVKPAAEQVYVNATAMSGFDSSTLPHYNAYTSGNCKSAGDPDCPCGTWKDVRDGVWTSSSYWCSNRTSGGWSNMDRGNGYYNGPVIPTGLTYDVSNKSGSKSQKRFLSYKDAVGAIVVAWRAQGWFVNMYEVTEHDKDKNTMTWENGGQQGGRGWQIDGKTGAIDPVPQFFIENVFEELDIPGEWYFDKDEQRLYLWWNATSGTPPPASVSFVATKHKRLIEVVGTREKPVKNVVIRGMGFRDAAYTYMDEWAPPSGGDWALHRGAAVFLERTEKCTVQGNIFNRVDGNAVLLSGYNRDTTVDSNEFVWIGDTAMAGWGYTDEHDGTGGDQPRGTVISNNICHELGIFELQSSCWFQAKTAQTVLKRNIFFNGPRAGINFNDGFGGGNDASENVIFNMCRQSGDHGPINSWDRQLFWTDVRGEPGWNPAYSNIAYNMIIANYGGSQGFDNDDGSSWYDIHHNVIYGEGLKQDYGGHDSKYHDNINLVHKYDGQNCINTWPFKLGQGPCGDWSEGSSRCSHGHWFVNNTCIVLYTDVYAAGTGSCPPDLDHMPYLADNSYYTPTAGNATAKRCGTIAKMQKGGSELGSRSLGLPSDAEWVAWAKAMLKM